MHIAGLQKLTLLDYPGKMACTIFLSGCNFACPFCHNASLVLTPGELEQAVSQEEFFAFLKKRQGILDGVCVTGGEPLLSPGLPEFLVQIKALGYLIKLDTNGFFPERLKALVQDKLIDMVAMDIKNSREHYAMTAGVENLELAPIEESVSFLLRGIVPYEFRTTIIREFHTEEDIRLISRWTAGAEAYFLQAYEDRNRQILCEEQGKGPLHSCSKKEMEYFREILSETVKLARLRGI